LILTPALLPPPLDHSTISKIIGVCWRTLPARQRKRWEQKALEAKAAHKKLYPDYRYTPVHRKGPSRKKAKKEQKKDDARCEELAQLLLSGSKGADLEERVKKLDESNPDSYQSTLSFSTPADQQLQQFTFVQGFPAAGHSIQVPTAPNVYLPHQYHPNQPRRHSSAPPADNAFLEANNPSSSSTASSPRTTSRDLSLHNEGENISPTDTTVPLSRIARKLPTKSTHHLQPHHFRDEANVLAAAANAGNSKKLKSSMSKAVRARAQGFGAPQPVSERDQLFIQSHWTNASIDPSSSTTGEKKKKTKRQVIPQDMLMATWDLNENQQNNASPTVTSQVVPLPPVPGYVSAEHYSPSYAPAYVADDKYSQYDGAGVGPFDLLTYQDYGLPGLDVDPLGGDAALNAALNGVGAVNGFDFADQFGALGVDGDTNEEYVCLNFEIWTSVLTPDRDSRTTLRLLRSDRDQPLQIARRHTIQTPRRQLLSIPTISLHLLPWLPKIPWELTRLHNTSSTRQIGMPSIALRWLPFLPLWTLSIRFPLRRLVPLRSPARPALSILPTPLFQVVVLPANVVTWTSTPILPRMSPSLRCTHRRSLSVLSHTCHFHSTCNMLRLLRRLDQPLPTIIHMCTLLTMPSRSISTLLPHRLQQVLWLGT